MPAEVTSTDPAQPQPVEKMSATTQKPLSEMPQTIPAFSYAQAAKGRSPSVPSLVPAGKALSDTTETDAKNAPNSETRNSTADSNKTSTKRTASEGHAPQGKSFKAGDERRPAQAVETQTATKTDALLSDISSPAKPSKPISSTPSSPVNGNDTTSTATLPKENDMFSTANGLSDATSDKQSQASQNGHKFGEKIETEKEQNPNIPWDEETPAAASLKEALPPAVNIWQQRREAQAKSKPSILPQPPKPANLSNGPVNTGGTTKNTEANNEPKKQDSRKKGKTGSGPAEDRTALGNTRDGSKSADAVDKSVSIPMAPPPPPGDAISWPTPENALGEAKKKAPERAEKSEKELPQGSKPHGKERWVPVPFVPTPVFNTPIPTARRGGRGPRGGREGGARGGNTASGTNGTERPPIATATNPRGQAPAPSGNERERAVLSSTTTNANLQKPKRASSAGPTTPTEQRKTGDASVPEKRKEVDNGSLKANQNGGNVVNESRRPSAPRLTKDSQIGHPANAQVNEPVRNPTDLVQNKTDEEVKYQNGSMDPRPNGSERRSEGSIKSPDHVRDIQGHFPPRERGEGRPERGRGGYRGRGGVNHTYLNPNAPNGHVYANGHANQYQHPSAPLSNLRSNHDRLPSQPQGSYQPPPQQTKHYRTSSRSQSIPYQSPPHAAPYRGFSSGHHGQASHLANLQTDIANEFGYQPGHQGIMSAMPYDPLEQANTWSMVQMQIEYYFSIDNLCKDTWLRARMDSQGYVLLDIVAQFSRIKALAAPLIMIHSACFYSQNLELYTHDGIDRIRRRHDWQQWVLEMKARDQSAQNDGPPPPPPRQFYGFDPSFAIDDGQGILSHTNSNGNTVDHSQFQSFNGVTPPFGAVVPSAPPNNVDAPASQPPLSAAVSEFTPPMHSVQPPRFSTPEPHPQGTSVFTDAQADQLNILVRKPGYAVSSGVPPFHSASSRTFSNGSIDGRSINEELTKFAEGQSRPSVNGDASGSVESNRTQRPRSPFPIESPGPGRQMDNNVSPPVLWIKDRHTPFNPHDSLPNECVYESYHDFRLDALKQRERSSSDKDHHDMQNLYQFWSHFLVRNFNARMYEELRQFALEDVAQRGSTTGMQSLLQYYYESILSQKTVADDNIARDFVNVVKYETPNAERPAFTKLRAKWRDGAFNMKNRHKLTKFIDADLKTELER